MAKATLSSISSQSEKFHARYMREYAGQPRHTRNLRELERMVEKTDMLARRAKALKEKGADELHRALLERLKLYVTERDAIAAVQLVRPEAAEVHRAGLLVDRALTAWRRHFAGRDRRNRDLTYLEWLIERMEKSYEVLERNKNLPAVNADRLEPVAKQLETLKAERDAIVAWRKEASPAEYTAAYLAEANAAVEAYRAIFAGQPRPTAPLPVLKRIIRSIEGARKVVAGFEDPTREKNVEILDKHLETYYREERLIADARRTLLGQERTTVLAQIANLQFELYQKHFAGQDRVSRDLKLLSDICDRLAVIGEDMLAHEERTQDPTNRKNLGIVEDRLRRYEMEWGEILRSKSDVVSKQQASAVAADASVGSLGNEGGAVSAQASASGEAVSAASAVSASASLSGSAATTEEDKSST